MHLSVLICTWNNSARLAITLDSLSRCIIPPGLKWEVVLVNNNCTDDTDRVVQRFADKLPLFYVREPRQGLSRARNAGLKVASGQLIVFTDDDVKPSPEWIAAYWSAYQDKPNRFYFGGPVESEYETPDADRELLRLAPPSVQGLDWTTEARSLGLGEYFISGNWGCPLEALRSVGGFDVGKGLGASSDKVQIGEESDVMDRLRQHGWSSWYLPRAKLIHFVPAEKCRLKHIVARAEASGIYRASKSINRPHGPVIAGIPRWVYKKVVVSWIAWIWALARGKKGYREYLDFRSLIGTAKGFREFLRSPKRISGRKEAVAEAHRKQTAA